MSETPAATEARVKSKASRKRTTASKGKRSHNRPSYSSYHHRLFKEIASKTSNKTGSKFGIKKKAMTIIDSVFFDILDKYCNVLYEMLAKESKKIVTQRDMVAATNFIFTGELLNHALSHGAKSVADYQKLNPGSTDKKGE